MWGDFEIVDKDDVSLIESTAKANRTKLSQFNDYLAYSVELGYDLAIRTSVNIR